MRSCIAWFASIAIAQAGAVALAANASHPSLVPWKVLAPGTPPEQAPLVLFWVPASREELRRSPLLTSDELTRYSSQCVAMRVVRLDDRERLARLEIADEIPAVILTAAEGEVLGKRDAHRVADVEAMVREELQTRAATAEAMLDRARERAEAGEVEAAVAIYRQVWSQRCECPRQGKAAHRALRKLER